MISGLDAFSVSTLHKISRRPTSGFSGEGPQSPDLLIRLGQNRGKLPLSNLHASAIARATSRKDLDWMDQLTTTLTNIEVGAIAFLMLAD